MTATISAITSSTWYTSAISAASSIGGYIQLAAEGAANWTAYTALPTVSQTIISTGSAALEGLSWTAYTALPTVSQTIISTGSAALEGLSWTAYTALPTVGQAITSAGSAALEGLSWTVFTFAPAAATDALYALTQLFHATVAAPFVIIHSAQRLWSFYPIQTALMALTFVGARLAVDGVERQPRIQHLPHKGRVMARFIAAMGIAGVAVSFGGLLGLTLTSYKLYAVALTLFAAMDSTTRAFLQNAINQREAGTDNTVPLYVRISGNVEDAFTNFDPTHYSFSHDLTPEPAELLRQAKEFEVRASSWIELSEWITKLNLQNDKQKAYALALWVYLVETQSPLKASVDTDLTVHYNHTTWSHTVKIKAPQEEVDDAALVAE